MKYIERKHRRWICPAKLVLAAFGKWFDAKRGLIPVDRAYKIL